MNESTMRNCSVQFNTGGSQPLTLTPVALPRVETHSASKRTLRKRTKQLNDIIHLSAGDNDEAYAAQTSNIIKTADEVTREAIISKLNIKTTIPAEHVAAMKATQNIPWNLLEEVLRWLSTFNVQLSTKNKGHIIARMNMLHECNLLVSHPFIPDDDIHVKIGGDHGGGSFKMSYQIANVSNPKKLDDAVIFSIFEAKDSRANLRYVWNVLRPMYPSCSV